MKVSIKYFASLREAFGLSQETLEFDQPAVSVDFVRDTLIARGGVFAEKLNNEQSLRVAVNFQVADGNTWVDDGAEMAFFPPVTGG